MTVTSKLAIGSLIVGLAVLALKGLAYWVTGSVALLSDALESTVNLATAGAALIAVRVAERPADANHPYGHHKAEFFSAILEGALIVLAALAILRAAADGLMNPAPLSAPLAGLAVNAAASVVNGLWCWRLLTEGRRLHSPALVADGRHLLTDVVSSVGVTAGVLLAIATGWPLLDPAMAALVAVNILWAGWRVMRESLSGLMDEAVADGVLDQVHAVIAAEGTGAIEAHDIRTRQAGQATFVEFHLVVPGVCTVADAHAICDRVEAGLKRLLPESVITIHVEPEEKAKQEGVAVP